MMAEREFVDAVMARVFRGRRPCIMTRESVERGIRQLFEYDYSETDAVRTARCWEEVNPKLDERTALAVMKGIADKYPKAVAARKQR